MFPGSFRGKFLKGSEGVCLASPSDNELSDHNRHAEENNAQKIDDYESRAAVGSYKIREPPQVTQSDSGTYESEYYT